MGADRGKSRIEHLIVTQEVPTEQFRFSMLLKFYRQTLVRLLHENAQLVSIITKYQPSIPIPLFCQIDTVQSREIRDETIPPSDSRKST